MDNQTKLQIFFRAHLIFFVSFNKDLVATTVVHKKTAKRSNQTVEEKLEQTLQNRLKASFETVSKQLESVNQGR